MRLTSSWTFQFHVASTRNENYKIWYCCQLFPLPKSRWDNLFKQIFVFPIDIFMWLLPNISIIFNWLTLIRFDFSQENLKIFRWHQEMVLLWSYEINLPVAMLSDMFCLTDVHRFLQKTKKWLMMNSSNVSSSYRAG